MDTKYRFTFTKTATGRRYSDLQTGRADLMFFEMPKWGWNEMREKFNAIRKIISGEEAYLAVAKPGRDQSYITDMQNKRLAATSVYHYRFSSFNANKMWLRNNYKITLTKRHTRNIRIL